MSVCGCGKQRSAVVGWKAAACCLLNCDGGGVAHSAGRRRIRRLCQFVSRRRLSGLALDATGIATWMPLADGLVPFRPFTDTHSIYAYNMAAHARAPFGVPRLVGKVWVLQPFPTAAFARLARAWPRHACDSVLCLLEHTDGSNNEQQGMRCVASNGQRPIVGAVPRPHIEAVTCASADCRNQTHI